MGFYLPSLRHLNYLIENQCNKLASIFLLLILVNPAQSVSPLFYQRVKNTIDCDICVPYCDFLFFVILSRLDCSGKRYVQDLLY